MASCHERFKQSLCSTSGMLLLSAPGVSSSSQHQVLHRAQGAAGNFHSTIAWLRRDSTSSLLRTSSSPVATGHLHQLGAAAAARYSSTESLPSLVPPAEEDERGEAEVGLAAGQEAAAALRIQALSRGYRVRSVQRREWSSAVRLQATYRMWIEYRRFRRMRRAAEKIQRSYRTWKRSAVEQVRLLLETEQRRIAAAVVIQSHARGLFARRWRRRTLSVKRSARMIGEAYRTWKASRDREAAAARVIQKFVRRRKLLKENSRPAAAAAEDWNNVEVEQLEQCLDTCLATLHPRRPPPQQHPPPCTSSSRGYMDESSRRSLNEMKLQQVARVFLLQHHIALQQQHAKRAPPFPPDSGNRYHSHLTTTANPTSTSTATDHPKNHSAGDVVLDVQYLLEEARKLGASSSSDPVLYMQNDSIGLGLAAGQEIASSRQMNAFLVVIVAVVIYTRSICQEVFVWAKQTSTKK